MAERHDAADRGDVPGSFIQAVAHARDLAGRVERKFAKRFYDVELRQLRAMQRAYHRDGPELLVLGDSVMYWVVPKDEDRRHLVEMLRQDADASVHALVGPLYNARLVMAFLTALERCASRPKALVLPLNPATASPHWNDHPVLSYERAARGIRDIVDNGTRLRRLESPPKAEEEAYDRRPAASMVGARRTLGEHRLMLNSVPGTTWQGVARLRYVMDYHHGFRLEPDTEGVKLIGELASMTASLGIPVVAYLPPVNHEMMAKALGAATRDHVAHNAEVVVDAFAASAGSGATVLDLTFDHPSTEFGDVTHLTDVGRRKMAHRLAEAVRPSLGR